MIYHKEDNLSVVLSLGDALRFQDGNIIASELTQMLIANLSTKARETILDSTLGAIFVLEDDFEQLCRLYDSSEKWANAFEFFRTRQDNLESVLRVIKLYSDKDGKRISLVLEALSTIVSRFIKENNI